MPRKKTVVLQMVREFCVSWLQR